MRGDILENNRQTTAQIKSKEAKTILYQPLQNINTEMSQDTQPLFTKRIGSTTYTVSVHFSQTSKETAEDKLLRLIESEVCKSA
jgi:hypothetical protein